jgi:uncharacterized protein involved in type VI secretion and phage assembly
MRTGELYQRYYGLYLATVVDVNDPESLGRVRIECDQFEDTTDDPIWCSVARPAGGVTSVFFTPKVKDEVIVGFLVGDVNEPVIVGYAHGGKDRQPPSQVSPTKHGIVTTVGSVVFDEDAKKITVTFNAGPESTITMDSEGIVIKAPNIKMEAQTLVQIDSPRVRMNGQGVVLQPFADTTFVAHTHPTAMGPTAMPFPPVPLPNLDFTLK